MAIQGTAPGAGALGYETTTAAEINPAAFALLVESVGSCRYHHILASIVKTFTSGRS